MKKPFNNLHGLFITNGYSCKEVATKIGISAQAMSQKMRGASSFTAREMAAIGKLFSFSEEDYYTYFIVPTDLIARKGKAA